MLSTEQRGVLFDTAERGIHLTVFCAVDEDLKRKMDVEEQKLPEALPIAGGAMSLRSFGEASVAVQTICDTAPHMMLPWSNGN